MADQHEIQPGYLPEPELGSRQLRKALQYAIYIGEDEALYQIINWIQSRNVPSNGIHRAQPLLYACHDAHCSLLIKNNRLEEADAEARKMIDLEPKNPRGYMRFGQVRKTWNASAARDEVVECYNKALQRMDVLSAEYRCILKLRDE
ncbi:hypothetical protein BJ508DRAFT_126087 [Ascobolus immersus RN42]|uniref:TPR-like protein n=1 Tax=Ascobolus immersus RN42 TaxID=1160509 RepID=A0A3N4I3A4_ASCIM|nr:hypothetical protein BJ508DRAFT_126087 [Ascobolus immersus RN42]